MRRKKTVILMKEDIYLFDYLFRYRIASAKTIHKDIFHKYKSLDCTRVRLGRLKRAGYIRGKYYSLESKDMCYGLTSPVVKEFINFSKGSYIWKGTNSPNHDVDLIDIWRSLKNRDTINYMLTEHEYNVRDCNKCSQVRMTLGELRPDGYLEISIKAKQFRATLEYERSRKTKARYLDMIDRYYRNKEIKAVFYISEKEHIENQVKEAELEYRTRNQEPKFFYALREDIDDSNDLIFRTAGENEYQITMKVSDLDTVSCKTVPKTIENMQTTENIRKSIKRRFFAQNASSPLCTDFNNKTKTNINESGGLYGNQ